MNFPIRFNSYLILIKKTFDFNWFDICELISCWNMTSLNLKNKIERFYFSFYLLTTFLFGLLFAEITDIIYKRKRLCSIERKKLSTGASI